MGGKKKKKGLPLWISLVAWGGGGTSPTNAKREKSGETRYTKVGQNPLVTAEEKGKIFWTGVKKKI